MTTRYIPVVIATTAHRNEWCVKCHTNTRIQADFYALSELGVSHVGAFGYCPACDVDDQDEILWRCRICDGVCVADSPAVFDHLRTEHGWRIGPQ
jgi:hypothetical protein